MNALFRGKKRAVSPVIATVLLIGMTIVIGSILFLWLRGFTQEAVTKFDKNVDLVCNEVQLQASYSTDGTLGISNVGNVPIYNIKVKVSDAGSGSFETMDIKDLSENWKASGLNPGRTFSGNVNSYVSGAESITLIPVLIGSSASGEKAFTCNEDRSGYRINV
jgi:flagellin-like protein